MVSEEIKNAIYRLHENERSKKIIFKKIDELFPGLISYRGVVSIIYRRFNVKKKLGRPFALAPHHHIRQMITDSNDAQLGLVSGRELAVEIDGATGVTYTGSYINKLRARLGKICIQISTSSIETQASLHIELIPLKIDNVYHHHE